MFITQRSLRRSAAYVDLGFTLLLIKYWDRVLVQNSSCTVEDKIAQWQVKVTLCFIVNAP